MHSKSKHLLSVLLTSSREQFRNVLWKIKHPPKKNLIAKYMHMCDIIRNGEYHQISHPQFLLITFTRCTEVTDAVFLTWRNILKTVQDAEKTVRCDARCHQQLNRQLKTQYRCNNTIIHPVRMSRRRRSVRFIIRFCSFLSVCGSGSHQYSESRQEDRSTPRTLKEQSDEKWSMCVFIINNTSPLTAATAQKSAHKSAGASASIVKWPCGDFYQRKCAEINSACDKCHCWLILFLFPAFSVSFLREISRPSQARSEGIRGTFPVL